MHVRKYITLLEVYHKATEYIALDRLMEVNLAGPQKFSAKLYHTISIRVADDSYKRASMDIIS